MHIKKAAANLFLSVLAYLALWILIPKAAFLPAILRTLGYSIPITSNGISIGLNIASIIIMAMPTVAFMAAQIFVIFFYTKLQLNIWKMLLVLMCSVFCVALITVIIINQMHIVARLRRYPNFREIFFILGSYYGPLKALISLFIMIAASSIGCMVAVRIKDMNLILPVVIFAACIDFWTVTQGPVSSVIKHAPEVVSAVSAPIPQAGAGSFIPATMMGPGDPLFIALIFAAVHSLKMDSKRNFIFIFAAMSLGMVAVLIGVLPFLPALTFLAAAVIFANYREFKLSRDEKISVAVVGAILIIFTFWLLPMLQSHMK